MVNRLDLCGFSTRAPNLCGVGRARAPIFHYYDLFSNFIKPETISDAIDIKQELPDDNYEKMEDCDENLASNDKFLPFFEDPLYKISNTMSKFY